MSTELLKVAQQLQTDPRSPFHRIDEQDIISVLEHQPAEGLITEAPSRKRIATDYQSSIGKRFFNHSHGYEGFHLAEEDTTFDYVYISLGGALVRYSLLKSPDLSRIDAQNQNPDNITKPVDTTANLVSLGYLLAYTRIFDITHGFEMAGTTELLSKCEKWRTCLFQARSSKVLRLEKDFTEWLSDAGKAKFYENMACISIGTWAKRCIRHRDMLARVSAGQADAVPPQGRHAQDRHGDRSLFIRELAMEYLDRWASRIISLKPASQDPPTLNGIPERLSWFIGMRPAGFVTAWHALIGERRKETTWEPTGEAPVLSLVAKEQYAVNLARLREVRGATHFKLERWLDVPHTEN